MILWLSAQSSRPCRCLLSSSAAASLSTSLCQTSHAGLADPKEMSCLALSLLATFVHSENVRLPLAIRPTIWEVALTWEKFKDLGGKAMQLDMQPPTPYLPRKLRSTSTKNQLSISESPSTSMHNAVQEWIWDRAATCPEMHLPFDNCCLKGYTESVCDARPTTPDAAWSYKADTE